MTAIAIQSLSMPALKRTPPVNVNRGSKYDFDSLRPQTADCVPLFADDADGAKKAAAKLSSAVGVYRARLKETDPSRQVKLTVRTGVDGEGRHYAAVWKLKDSKMEAAAAGAIAEATGEVVGA